jgi:hypothetical protein
MLLITSNDPIHIRLRQSAARTSADVLLVYMRRSDWGERSNPLALAYLTIVGAWLAPGTELEAMTAARGVLIDVRNGFVYGVVSADSTRERTVPGALARDNRAEMFDQTRAESLDRLTQQAAELLADLGDRYKADTRARSARGAGPAAP